MLLYGWTKRDADISLPEQLQHFKTLQVLQIVKFENLESLPDWIGNLSSLKKLGLHKCKRLKELAAADAMKRLTKLRYLKIEKCPLLKQAIEIDWTERHKIYHIQVDTEWIWKSLHFMNYFSCKISDPVFVTFNCFFLSSVENLSFDKSYLSFKFLIFFKVEDDIHLIV